MTAELDTTQDTQPQPQAPAPPPPARDDEPEVGEGAAPTPGAPDAESPVLEISSEVTPPKLIRINGEDYHLFSFDHLSPEQEASVTATFSRFNKVFRRLETAKSDREATEDAIKLRQYREKLICALTDVPQSVVKGLKANKQGQLLTAIQEEIGGEPATDEDDDSER